MGEIADALRRAAAVDSARRAARGARHLHEVRGDVEDAPEARHATKRLEDARAPRVAEPDRPPPDPAPANDASGPPVSRAKPALVANPPTRTDERPLAKSAKRDSAKKVAAKKTARKKSAPRKTASRKTDAKKTRVKRAPLEAPTPAPAREVDALSPRNTAIAVEEGVLLDTCRHFALRVSTELEARGARSIAITSATRSEGKTTIACNLAIALATLSQDRRVALLDLDLRKPGLAEAIGIRHGCGIEEVLQGRVGLDAVRVPVRSPALDVYPAISPQTAAHEILALPAFGELVETLTERYEMVVVDTPPALVVPDAALIVAHVQACLVVAREDGTRTGSFREILELLPADRVLGQLICAWRV